MADQKTLKDAKANKKDEFYTRLEDIEAEISSHPDYVRQFKGKTVLCNCDDPEWSNFFKFFRLHFNQLGIKKLIATHYNKDGSPSYKLEWTGEKLDDDTLNMVTTPLQGDGDFRSDECIEILKEADIVVTNPPFSLFREYIAQLMEYNKKFIVIGNINAVSYKEFFPLIKDGKVWAGYSFNKTMLFEVGDGYSYDSKASEKIGDGKHYGKVPMIAWFTNLDIDRVHDAMPLTKNYKGNENKYPMYDNYDAIECGKSSDIPKDYDGVIGVPITFLGIFSPDQFEIVGLVNGKDDLVDINTTKDYALWHENKIGVGLTGACGKKINGNPVLRGKPSKGCYFTNDNDSSTVYSTYARIFIRRKKVS